MDGDIKNEFSKVHVEEANEFRELSRYLRSELRMDEVILVKGNHDNFIDRLGTTPGFRIYSQEAMISGMLFFHGEDLPKNKGGSLLVMGHIHPAIVVYNALGIREKLKCFLYGRLRDGREAIVLPAMNYFAEGVGVNSEDIRGMAPIFRDMLDISSMRALCIGEGETLDFGQIGKLKDALF